MTRLAGDGLPLRIKGDLTCVGVGNLEAYIRVRLVSYWRDADGNIVGKPSEMPAVSKADGWVKGSNDTYYYAAPVPAEGNDDTVNLLESPMALKTSEEGFQQVVEVFAEAIQSKPADAVTESWLVTLDEDGNITAAP